MITLNDKELKYAINIKQLIEKRGFNQLAKTEFDAGFLSQDDMYKVFKYLKQQGWSLADKLIEEDSKLLAELLKEKPEVIKEKTVLKTDLQRRIRNNFSTSEIRKLKLYHRPQNEVIPLLESREKERLYGIK